MCPPSLLMSAVQTCNSKTSALFDLGFHSISGLSNNLGIYSSISFQATSEMGKKAISNVLNHKG